MSGLIQFSSIVYLIPASNLVFRESAKGIESLPYDYKGILYALLCMHVILYEMTTD